MPEPVGRGQRYMPGLDGLRAIAVLGVVLYHLKFGWAEGGLLGVGVFFTLSGYLITDILLNQVNRGGIKLKSFWLARARRLLPALFLMLIVVTAWVTVIGPHQPSDFRMAVLSAVGYFNNWWLILHNVSYFARFAPPSPLNHLWSLSVEEQFYIVWPFLLMAALHFVPEARRKAGPRPRLAAVTLVAALCSGVLMAILYHPSLDPSRVYYGTDTRALELLVGAALAMVWPSRRLTGKVTPQARRTIDAAGLVGLIVIGLMFWRSNEFSPFLYRGGFALLALGTALSVAAFAHPASRLGPIVGCKPMQWIGERSYGIYLWTLPIIVLTSPQGVHGPNLLRAILQVAAIMVVAELSWRYLENPIRHGALGRLWKRWKAGELRRARVSREGWVGVAAAGLVVIAAIAGLAGVGVSNSPAIGSANVAKTVTAKNAKRKPLATSCKGVVHIGDSTSEGLVSEEYLPRNELIAAQYARVGATTAHLEVAGARSIYENFEGEPNAQEVAEAWKNEGFKGCWVIAMGTNEAANVAAGSNFTYDDRIESMMSTIGDEPVMWVNVKSLVPSGPYAETNMASWDKALREACDRYPNMRIYNWAADVQDKWFIPDGIHFTSEGYAARGRLIADALLESFPNTEPLKMTDAKDCVVSG
ncbi:MAG TPA: acyltransferase family protein [Solirubrobacterales bacterium]|jgi:peptidoglycan/LPS O-acetylase OafA/YrhL|nr:acyltransferase family protein [Solirubrobacterales bacterium]